MEKISAKEFDQKVLKSKKLVFVEFSGKNCEPCRQMIPIMNKVLDTYKNKDYIDFYEVVTEDNPELVERYSIMSIPHFTLFFNGQHIDEALGKKSEDGIKEFIAKSIGELKKPEFFDD